MIRLAAAALASANSAAEILEAREIASVAYDVAKRAARLAKAKGALDEVVAKVHRAQADALEIEAAAKCRIADEYDAAQERGEVQTAGGDRVSNVPKQNNAPTTSDLGISRKDIHEAREIRDAEKAEPGIVRKALDDALEAGQEPTRAKVKRATKRKDAPQSTKRRPEPKPNPPVRHGRGAPAICAAVREALMALSGLPPASEVVGFFRGTDGAVTVDDHVSSAARWLAEFSDLWRDGADAESHD